MQLDCLAKEMKKQGLEVVEDEQGRPQPVLPIDPITGEVEREGGVDENGNRKKCKRREYKNNHVKVARAEYPKPQACEFDDNKLHSEFDNVFDNYDGKPGITTENSISGDVWEDSPFETADQQPPTSAFNKPSDPSDPSNPNNPEDPFYNDQIEQASCAYESNEPTEKENIIGDVLQETRDSF